MPLSFQGLIDFPLDEDDIVALWQSTIGFRDYPDSQVNIRVVGVEEMQQLNTQYRNKPKPTNVLTFSYDDEHDIPLCMSVVVQEAMEQNVPIRDYTALILTHAFLHVTGLDHEKSSREAKETQELERGILKKNGFTPISL